MARCLLASAAIGLRQGLEEVPRDVALAELAMAVARKSKMIGNLAIANTKLDPHHFDDVVDQRDVLGGRFSPGLQPEE